MAKRINRADSTLRNVRASNKRNAQQDTRLDRIERRLQKLEDLLGLEPIVKISEREPEGWRKR